MSRTSPEAVISSGSESHEKKEDRVPATRVPRRTKPRLLSDPHMMQEWKDPAED